MAVTAYPVILVNHSAGGASDSLASGAGPGTALTGSAGVSAADGLSVILDGSPDLSGVAVDGSHALYYADATAAQLNFAQITATSNSGTPTATVTLANAVQAIQTKAWAIGGIRDTISGTASTKLVSNNGAAGDARPGWSIEMGSGHTESPTGTYIMRRAGDQTTGPIELRGAAGAGTVPVLTFTNNGIAVQQNASFQSVRDFELKNSAGTKTASEGVRITNQGCVVTGMRIKDGSGNHFWRGIVLSSNNSANIYANDIRNTASHGIEINTNNNLGANNIFANYIRDATGSGIHITAAARGINIIDNVVYSCTVDGLAIDAVLSTMTGMVMGNTFDSNADGIDIASDLESRMGMVFMNNILSNNTGFGLNWNSATVAAIIGSGVVVTGNAYYNNSGGDTDTPGYLGTAYTQAVDPGYVSATGDDFSIGVGLKAKAYPLGGTTKIGLTSATYSYVDPGAAQRQEPAGSGGIAKLLGEGGGLAA